MRRRHIRSKPAMSAERMTRGRGALALKAEFQTSEPRPSSEAGDPTQQSKDCATTNPERTLPTTEPAPRSDGCVRSKLQVADIAGHSRRHFSREIYNRVVVVGRLIAPGALTRCTEIAFVSMTSGYFATWLPYSDERRLHIIMIRTQPPIPQLQAMDCRCRSPFSDHPAGLSLCRLHTMPPPSSNRPPVGTLRAPPGLHGCPLLRISGCWHCSPATPPRWYPAAS
ncbi:hypothetical protein XAC3810_540009 [Xanthomonas citri pv. citri]|uniref:Uncharacterized protein n=1 Tax=Xanthomonas citri pv. citri TaxID=611301 RepID=A0A0U5GCD5_XANCI|nr:hypothetical protein HZS91_03488 [Xanthomonas citri pv. citri]QYF46130.1 hypothetical protein HZS93_03470 [Xanthomonas citri]QYF41314.1 hypothetical protein HZS92_03433 [Xanthomonas citri pv. citri]CEE33686.1 hypothetical protein XAC9322_530390 [Xanthomonas citri pv. citri]CEE34160.1 hypothetical protein XAC3824_710009 [Xanthomonas citri pv. citri]